MSYPGTLRGSVALAAVLVASGAHAELSADRVWSAWRAYSTMGDTTMDGSLSRDGNTLTASNVTVAGEAEDVRFTMTIDRIDFVEQTDGTVSVTMSDAYDMVISGEDGGRAVMGVRHPGLRITVSESATGLNHAFAASEYGISLDEFSGPGAPDELTMRLAALGIGGFYDIPDDPGGPFSSHFSFGTLSFALAGGDSTTDLDIDYSATGVRLSVGGTGFDQIERLEGGDMAGLLDAGFGVEFGFAFDTMRYGFDMTEFGERTAAAGTSMQGESRFVLNDREILVRTASRNPEITLSGGELPFPELVVRAGQLAYGMSMPTAGAAEPQDMSLLLRLVDVVVPDDVWAMADPSGQLGRGPSTVILDLAGQVVLPSDLFSMETMFGYMMGGPMEAAQPVALDIRELLVRAAGAELTGGGSFTFDPTDLETFEGLPRPTGTLNLTLRGGNALLDTLVGMGLLPEDQAMAARMVMALFARPGAGPDELVSVLEVQEDGSVFANGMRLQ